MFCSSKNSSKKPLKSKPSDASSLSFSVDFSDAAFHVPFVTSSPRPFNILNSAVTPLFLSSSITDKASSLLLISFSSYGKDAKFDRASEDVHPNTALAPINARSSFELSKLFIVTIYVYVVRFLCSSTRFNDLVTASFMAKRGVMLTSREYSSSTEMKFNGRERFLFLMRAVER